MGLYEVLAAEYKDIFPSSREKADFVETYLKEETSPEILDIGCASGEFVYQIASPSSSSQARTVTGIDLDSRMIETAKAQLTSAAKTKVQFHAADMLSFLKASEPETYDLICCFGNTIVYLDGEQALKDFLRTSFSSLKKNGTMLIQILNYTNPSLGPGFTFPKLETSNIEFHREYAALDDSEKLRFKTSIRDKSTGETMTDVHRHYPFLSSSIVKKAKEAGFTGTSIYGGYDRKEAEVSDFFHIIVLSK